MNLPFIFPLNGQFNPQLPYPPLLNNNFGFNEPVNLIPQGLQALYLACLRLYPDQLNPLQITCVRKYWLGGSDPLDYISVYNNPGDPKKNIPPHWHYISFGLSDLYGDMRIHPRMPNQELSGFGFELTFRLKKKISSDAQVPIWPAHILQSLAKYVFHTGNTICPGDHVSENKPFDSNNANSRIEHMLMTDDPQLATVLTPFGKTTFIQIVGVTSEELKAAQRWNVNGMIELMKRVPEIGGDYLVTDMQRQHSIFELNNEIQQAVERGIANEGSNLSGVSAKCSFKPRISFENLSPSDEDNTSSIANSDEEDEEEFYDERSTSESVSCSDEEKENETKNDENMKLINVQNVDRTQNELMNQLNEDLSRIQITKENKDAKESIKSSDQATNAKSDQTIKDNQATATEPEQIVSPMSVTHENQNNCSSSMSYNSETGGNEPVNDIEIKYLKEVHIFLNLEAGLLLPLVLRGRLKHNHHFTYKSTKLAITFLTPSVSGAYVSVDKPFGFYGSWLQILLEDNLVEKMILDLENAEHKLNPNRLPKTFSWDNLAITIEPEE